MHVRTAGRRTILQRPSNCNSALRRKQNASPSLQTYLQTLYRLQTRHCTSEAECLSLQGLSTSDSALHIGGRPPLSPKTIELRFGTAHRSRTPLSRTTIDLRFGTAQEADRLSLSNDYRLVMRHCTSEAERLSLQRLSNCDSALHIGSRTPLSRTAIELRLGTAQWTQNASLSSTTIEL